MTFLTSGTDEVAPHLRELVEHEEYAKEPGHDDVGRDVVDFRVGLGDDGQVRAFGAPEGRPPEADQQAGGDHGEEARMELGEDEGHVNDEGHRHRPLRAEPPGRYVYRFRSGIRKRVAYAVHFQKVY